MRHDSNDGEKRILSLLRRGLEESDPVPKEVVDFAKAALSWRTLDAELAAISYDSSEEKAPAGVRGPVMVRMLSFHAGDWVIDVEYHEATRRLVGLVEPSGRVTVELHLAGGFIVSGSDDLGRFAFDGVLPGPASLVIRTGGDLEVVKTEWTVL